MDTEQKWAPKKPFHYVYLLHHAETGLYYIGVRSSYNKPEKDLYYGSGSLLWDVYRQQGYYHIDQGKPNGWEKYIVAVFPDRISANQFETQTIAAERKNPYCLNCTFSKKLRLKQLTKN